MLLAFDKITLDLLSVYKQTRFRPLDSLTTKERTQELDIDGELIDRIGEEALNQWIDDQWFNSSLIVWRGET